MRKRMDVFDEIHGVPGDVHLAARSLDINRRASYLKVQFEVEIITSASNLWLGTSWEYFGGARVGCLINTSTKCNPPWRRTLFGGGTTDLLDRGQCQEHEMTTYLASSRESCLKLSKENCLNPFRDAWIALIDPKKLRKGETGAANFQGSVILDTKMESKVSPREETSSNQVIQD